MPQDRRSALQTTPGAHPRGRAVSGPPWSLAPPASIREERQLTAEGAARDSLDALITDLAGGHGASQGKGGRPKKVEGENRARASAVNGKSARRVTYSTRSLAARLAESANPKVPAAADPHRRPGNSGNRTAVDKDRKSQPRSKGGGRADHRLARLKRDHPAIAARFVAGEFRGNVAAAERAARGPAG